MGHAHAHSATAAGSGTPELRVPAVTRRVMTGVVVVLALVVAAGGAWLWPRGPVQHTAAIAAVQQDTETGTIVSVDHRTCPGTTDDRSADGSLAPSVACATVKVRLSEGPAAGTIVKVQVTGPVVTENLAPGVGAVVARFPDVGTVDPGHQGGTADAAGVVGAGGTGVRSDVYAWVDFERATPMWLLFAGFVMVVIAVARLRGIAALAGVGAGFAMILVFLLPALRRGEDPVAVTLVGSAAVMLVVLYASHGVSAKTTCALFGTVVALGTAAGLAAWAVSAAHLDGQTGEDALSLTQLVGAGTVSAAVTSGMLLAGLGVLNDVTVTQASAVWEIKAAAPHLSGRGLFTRGMRVGRDHLASTVYTIAFAYAGVSLPVLLLIQVYDRPITEVLTSAPIAQDVVGLLVGGIGLASAIPLTTAVAALVAARAAASPDLPATSPAESATADRAPAAARSVTEVPLPRGDLGAATTGHSHPIESAPGVEAFEEGLLFRRRGPGRGARRDDQWDEDAGDWSSWPG